MDTTSFFVIESVQVNILKYANIFASMSKKKCMTCVAIFVFLTLLKPLVRKHCKEKCI